MDMNHQVIELLKKNTYLDTATL